MTTLTDLIAQKVTLERRIRDAESTAKADAIAQVRKLMVEHGLTTADFVAAAKGKHGAKAGSKVAPKYRDPFTGSTWMGRGLKPKWLTAALETGKSVEEFAI